MEKWRPIIFFHDIGLLQVRQAIKIIPDQVLVTTEVARDRVGEGEAVEVYVVAAHKGNPADVQKKVGLDGADGLKERAAVARSKRKSRRSWA